MSARGRVELFEDKAGQWRWRRRAGNGLIVATSGESYESQAGARAAAERENPGATTVVLTTTEVDE